MREVPSCRARLRKQLRNRCLQQVFREEKRGFECDTRRRSGKHATSRRSELSVGIEKPGGSTLEDFGEQPEHLCGWIAAAALDHAEIRDGRRRLRVDLRAARR